MSVLRRSPAVALLALTWIAIHVLALVSVGRAAPEGAPWWAWGLLPDDLLRRLGANVPTLVRAGEVRRLLTYAFLHAFVLGLALDVWILWGAGRRLEAVAGTARFWIVFVAGALGGGVTHVLLGHGTQVGAWPAILGVLGAVLVWAFLSPDPHARAARASSVIFLLVIAAFALVFDASVERLLPLGGALAAGGVAMALLGPRRIARPAGRALRGLALVLLLFVLVAGALQAFDTASVDTGEVRAFLQRLEEAERLGGSLARAPHRATPERLETLATKLAALRDPPCLEDAAPEAREALDAYLDVWLRVAHRDVPDPFAFDAALDAARRAWRRHEDELRARAGVGRSWSGRRDRER